MVNFGKTRSQTHQLNNLSAIWHPKDVLLAKNAATWTAFQNEKQAHSFKVLKDEENCFVNVDANTHLYLLCHGHLENELSSPKSPNNLMTNQSIE